MNTSRSLTLNGTVNANDKGAEGIPIVGWSGGLPSRFFGRIRLLLGSRFNEAHHSAICSHLPQGTSRL